MLDIFESLGDEVTDPDRLGRHSIEHAALVAPEDSPRIAKL